MTKQLPKKGDVVFLTDWKGVIGICKEYDPEKPNSITLGWPKGSLALFWEYENQEFSKSKGTRLAVTVLSTPVQVLKKMATMALAMKRREEEQAKHAPNFRSIHINGCS